MPASGRMRRIAEGMRKVEKKFKNMDKEKLFEKRYREGVKPTMKRDQLGPRKMKKAGGKAFDMLKVKPTVKGKKLKPVPMDKKKSLGKLPTKVRNKMGYMKKGGMAKKGMCR